MFKKEITYKDFLGQTRTETFRFNITENEMLDLVQNDPSFNVDYLTYLMQNPDGLKMIDIMRKIIVVSYGELSEDGKHFRKSDQIATDFVQSAAYVELLNEFIESKDPDFIRSFMTGVFPAKYAAELQKKTTEQLLETPLARNV